MSRTKYSEYSATPGDNTDIDGINIGEGMAPSDVNNSIRAFLSQTREFIDGSSGDTLTSAKIVVTTAEILSGVNVTGTATFNSAVIMSSSVTGSALSLSGALTVGGATILSSSLGVTGTASMGVIDAATLEVTNLKARDGTSAGSIADSTGVVTLASAVLTTADINGGTLDNAVVGGATPAAGTFTTATATTGNITTVNATAVNATTLDATNVEVTNIKAKDGTAAATIADSTGVVTIPSAVLTTADINGGTVDNAAVGAGTPSTGAFTTLSSNSTTTLNGTTIPASKTLLVSTDIGSTVQAFDANTAKFNDTTANFTGTLQNGGSNVLVDTDIGTNVQAYDAQLADVAGLTPADGSFIVGNGTNFVTEDGATARTSLGLGSISTQAADNVNIDGGAVDGVTLGTNSAVTEAQIDNVNINGNAIVSTNTDGNLSLTPNGTGNLVLDGLNWPQADGVADYVLKTDGSGQLSWTEQTGGGGSGTVTSVDLSGGTTGLTTSGGPVTTSGTITLAGTLAAANGGTGQTTYSNGQLLIGKTDGSLAKATLTAGSNVTITNGDGTIEIASTGGGGGGGGTSVTVTQITATASQTTFNVTYTVGQLSVYLNGALLASADFTATNGTTVVLAAGAASGDIFTALAYDSATQITQGDTKVEVTDSGTGKVEVTVDNVEVADFTTGAIVFNETGANQDFRVEGDSNANLLVADAGVDKVGIGTNTFNTNGGVLQVSNGISFPATQSALSDANTLDDYEEGTWTPVLNDASNDLATMSANNSGRYTKIGRMVHLSAYVETTALGSVNGNLFISGCPFTWASGAYDISAGATLGGGLNITAGQSVVVCASGSQTQLQVFLTDLTTGGSRMQATEWTDDGNIRLSIVHIV